MTQKVLKKNMNFLCYKIFVPILLSENYYFKKCIENIWIAVWILILNINENLNLIISKISFEK